jgi:hypothetical protein
MSLNEANGTSHWSLGCAGAAAWKRGAAMALLAACALLGQAGAATADADHGTLRAGISKTDPDTLIMLWSGTIAAPMSAQISEVFEQKRHQTRRVVLKLDSVGGSVNEGERAIEVLRNITRTHRLETVVEQGRMCGSMCVFIYLQGQQRTAALSSLWLFHEISKVDPKTKQVVSLKRAPWEALVDKYYPAAGVSSEWTARMKPNTIKSDYWQTGADLVNDHSGIVHVALSNRRERVIAGQESPAQDRPRTEERPQSASTSRPAPQPVSDPRPAPASGKECKMFVAQLGISVAMPCPTVSMRD